MVSLYISFAMGIALLVIFAGRLCEVIFQKVRNRDQSRRLHHLSSGSVVHKKLNTARSLNVNHIG